MCILYLTHYLKRTIEKIKGLTGFNKNVAFSSEEWINHHSSRLLSELLVASLRFIFPCLILSVLSLECFFCYCGFVCFLVRVDRLLCDGVAPGSIGARASSAAQLHAHQPDSEPRGEDETKFSPPVWERKSKRPARNLLLVPTAWPHFIIEQKQKINTHVIWKERFPCLFTVRRVTLLVFGWCSGRHLELSSQ